MTYSILFESVASNGGAQLRLQWEIIMVNCRNACHTQRGTMTTKKKTAVTSVITVVAPGPGPVVNIVTVHGVIGIALGNAVIPMPMGSILG